MSIKNGVWSDAELDPPRAEEMNKPVLIVKESKSGDRTIAFGSYNGHVHPGETCPAGTWSTNNGKGHVLWWMPLPRIPD